jgi:hypothetical protein
VNFEGDIHPLSLKLSRDVPVPAVKEMIIENLKKQRPNIFGSIVLDVDWLNLKTFDDKEGIVEEVDEWNMPKDKIKLSVEITIPEKYQNSRKCMHCLCPSSVEHLICVLVELEDVIPSAISSPSSASNDDQLECRV